MSRSVDQKDELFRWSDQLPTPLWDDIRARPAHEAANAVGAVWDGLVFKVPMLGFTYIVDPLQQRILREGAEAHRVSYQSGVVLLGSLAKSMGVPPSGRMVTPQALTGGSLFFTGAHSLAVQPLAKRFGHDPQGLITKAQALGGQQTSGADAAVTLCGLPLLPLYVLLWAADDEFAARAVIGIDDRALFHLDLAGIFALTNIMVNRLAG
ncbi:MAG: hypothetical protein VR64_20915 [Desulfatitalea sp. BRH_c12]|nr:MAG: hypothetical protein VR64_20915 [Desulfatitalea sp. BRH_c12]